MADNAKSTYETPNLYRLMNPLKHDGEPLMLDGKPLESLTLRKLRPSELSGINLVDVGMGDIPMALEMLKRSSEPHLGDMVYDLDLPVITEAVGVFKRFFTTRSMPGSAMSGG
jgi:hypothetical protein